ncbi:MAG: hypothetical protein A2Y28_05290 [Chlamydiae bacterium GWC2_50_10]|nr:MAG: hypothetical protein A2Z85_05115 [Chlamydiae bacterium GWA2_50_15]OGN54012.1 MAG: hypothetical protein A2Y28_05290 [Chlamydiae bacterium GWC2_50_10]OGN54622.1 MAG: hypothetical protein A2098_03515 [Chlamydiae bacterium GWF2_49_8]OGN57208.1 MAG: hypothetical protein A3D18_01830 [Chlamydiae bacterium RIFCSPHIGHO2_02_FULL_49_29]OGN63300.1 MAG: hypothetical protein A3E26_04670 [Chlamydiae bacterium RIFCSPHIGHO2_12_FULL_49_32]OGN70990.1 MAG: hypothetical protein A3I15_05395 [Chlamydiae bact
MNEDAVSLGALVKARRGELQLSLKEVQNSTSIRSMYLQAIEEGRVYEFISGVYALGFMRQYIQFLGLDAEELSKEYPLAFRIVKEKQEFAYGLGTLEPRGSAAEGKKFLPNALWILLSLGMVALAYFAARHFGFL